MTLEIQSQTIGKKNHPQAYGLRSQLLGSKFQVCCVTCTSRLPSLCPGFLHYTMETTAAHTSGLSQRLPVLGTVNAQSMLPLLLFLSGKKKVQQAFQTLTSSSTERSQRHICPSWHPVTIVAPSSIKSTAEMQCVGALRPQSTMGRTRLFPAIVFQTWKCYQNNVKYYNISF